MVVTHLCDESKFPFKHLFVGGRQASLLQLFSAELSTKQLPPLPCARKMLLEDKHLLGHMNGVEKVTMPT